MNRSLLGPAAVIALLAAATATATAAGPFLYPAQLGPVVDQLWALDLHEWGYYFGHDASGIVPTRRRRVDRLREQYNNPRPCEPVSCSNK
jgi:hypothetical protein